MKNICTLALVVLLCGAIGSMAAAQTVLSWQDCIIAAKKNNPQLLSALKKVEQARADVGIARSPLLPQVNAQALAGKSKAEPYPKQDNYSYGVTAQQTLFDAKSYNDLQKYKKILAAQEYDYAVVSSNIRFNLYTAFVQLLRAQEAIHIMRDIAKRRRSNLELVKMRYKAGREHLGALKTSEANVTEADYDVAQAKRDIMLAQRLLIRAMGVRNLRTVAVKGDLLIQGKKSDPDFQALAGKNPLLRQMVELKNSAEYQVKSAKSDFFPKVYAFMSAGKTDNVFLPEKNQWSIGVQANLPLITGGSRVYAVSKAKSLYEQYQFDEKNTLDAVIITMEQRWLSFLNGIDTIVVQLKYLEAAQIRSKIAESQYSIGSITYNNWIIIEDDLVRTKKSYLEALANARYAHAYWIQAKGDTLDDEK